MKLKRIIEQAGAAAQYYDLGKDFFSFTHAMDMADETVKSRFEQAIAAKLKGKKIRARASRGYKQFEKDYDINAVSVSLDDYYDNYVIVVKDTLGKEYFLKPGFKVQIVGQMEQPSPEQPQAPQSQPPTPPAPQPKAPAPQGGGQQSSPSSLPQSSAQPEQPAAQAPAQQPSQVPTQAPEQAPAEPKAEEPKKKEVTEEEQQGGATEIVRKYAVDKIVNDLQRWLPPLLPNKGINLKTFIPRDGVSRTKGRQTHTSYGLAIPVEEVPALTADQIKQALNAVTRVGDIEDIYRLDKFDVRGGKYIIIVNKVSSY